MNTEKADERLQNRIAVSGEQRKWNLFIGDEPYGFVHASSEREALDRVAAFKRPFRAVLASDQD